LHGTPLIGPHIEPHQRAGVFSGIYAVAYLAFSVPLIIAGQLVPLLGLVPTLQAYGAAIIAFAVMGIVVQAVRMQRDAARKPVPAGSTA
jgi:hypothetical protein